MHYATTLAADFPEAVARGDLSLCVRTRLDLATAMRRFAGSLGFRAGQGFHLGSTKPSGLVFRTEGVVAMAA